jgi:hypothetical protein
MSGPSLNPKDGSAPQLPPGDTRDSYRMLPKLQWAALVGCILILAYAYQFRRSGEFLSISAAGVTLAGAALLLGFLAGFIFCIPRAAKRPDAAASSTPGTASAPPKNRSSFDDNSNLVDISDWLTKILVGAGLVELTKIPHALWALCAALAAGLRSCGSAACVAESQTFSLAILLFFFPAGFLIGYLWTRLYYQKALSELVDQNAALSGMTNAREVLYDALSLMQSEDWKDALDRVDRSLDLDRSDGRAYFEKARILKKLAEKSGPIDTGLLRDALAQMSQAVRLLPDNPSALYNLACYQNLLHYEKTVVLATLKRACDLRPDLKAIAVEDPDLGSLGLKDNPEFSPQPAG